MTERDRTDEPVELPAEIESLIAESSARGLEPGRDLWPEIEAELPPKRRRTGRRRLLVAAALLLSTVAVWRLLDVSDTPAPLDLPSRSRPPLTTTSDELREAVGAYRSESERLLTQVARELDRYPDALGADVRSSLETFERALAELEGAVTALPGDEALETRLASLYEQQLDALRGLHGRLKGSGGGDS